MKQSLLVTFFVLSATVRSLAQDVIYTANGNRLDSTQITGLTEDKITFSIQKAGRVRVLSFQRQNVLVAFNRMGNFLVISALSSDLAQAQQQLQAFRTAPPVLDGKDYLIKAVPLTVIPANISYDSPEVVNYKTPEGKSASISKQELAAILYRDGRHAFLREPAEVTSLLPDVRKKIEEGKFVPTQPATNDSTPVTQTPTTQTTDASSTPQAGTPAPQVQPNVVNITNIIPSAEAYTPTKESHAPTNAKPVLSEAEYQTYRQKALQKVDEFVSYLNIITNKSLSSDVKDEAVAQAADLFMPAATIEVTSANRPGSRRYPIRDYLTRLKLLPYSSAKIEWSEVQYLKELSQAADGNYYGVITGEQTFIGYGKQGHNVIYSDVVQKNVRVKLQSYTKEIDSRRVINWDVLLGSIGVAAQ